MNKISEVDIKEWYVRLKDGVWENMWTAYDKTFHDHREAFIHLGANYVDLTAMGSRFHEVKNQKFVRVDMLPKVLGRINLHPLEILGSETEFFHGRSPRSFTATLEETQQIKNCICTLYETERGLNDKS